MSQCIIGRQLCHWNGHPTEFMVFHSSIQRRKDLPNFMKHWARSWDIGSYKIYEEDTSESRCAPTVSHISNYNYWIFLIRSGALVFKCGHLAVNNHWIQRGWSMESALVLESLNLLSSTSEVPHSWGSNHQDMDILLKFTSFPYIIIVFSSNSLGNKTASHITITINCC